MAGKRGENPCQDRSSHKAKGSQSHRLKSQPPGPMSGTVGNIRGQKQKTPNCQPPQPPPFQAPSTRQLTPSFTPPTRETCRASAVLRLRTGGDCKKPPLTQRATRGAGPGGRNSASWPCCPTSAAASAPTWVGGGMVGAWLLHGYCMATAWLNDLMAPSDPLQHHQGPALFPYF
jgi:hypothetical protein